MRTIEYGTAFAVGAVVYTFLEIAFRGYTHWTMTLTGGFCLVIIYFINDAFAASSAPVKYLMGALIITVMEFIVGCIVNLGFHQNVWDYSGLRFNIMGQVCLYFSILWYFLSIPAFYLCNVINGAFGV